jgi:uncharacterized protein YbjQ (UPF0145 family)
MNEAAFVTLVVVMSPFLIFIAGCIIGCLTESAHYKKLARDEQELSDVMVSDMKVLPANWNASNPVFVCENVAIANDFWKTFLFQFRKIFGGPCYGFQRMLERARREALVRMMRRAKSLGANVVWNVRFDTMNIKMGSHDGNGKYYAAGVEVCAYGTAFFVKSGE